MNDDVSNIAGEVVDSIPEKIQWYSDVLRVAENALFAILERFDIDPSHFMFLALVLLLIVLGVFSKLKVGKYIFFGIIAVGAIAWVL